MENEQYYIYGKLNQSEILKEYESKETDTAKTEVDNTNNTISVNVKAVPGILHIFDNKYPLDTVDYNGSENKELDLSKYVDEIKLTNMKNYLLSQDFAKAELKSESDKKNVLHFYRADNTKITSVELSGFTQVQSDLSVTNPLNEAFVHNKSTMYLVNDGEDGTSNYATQKWTQNEISKHSIDLDVVKDISLSQNETPDYLAIKKDFVNLNTAKEKSEDVTLPLATNSKSGLMSSADVNAISDLKGRVENLEGKTTRLLYDENENPTTEQINTFVEKAGYTSPFEGIAVVVDKTFHIWHYYENIGWQDDGQDTVSTFTNSIAGIIKGSEIEGRVYAENDGTGSLVGYDNLKNKTDIIKNDGEGNTYLNDKGEYTEIVTNRAFPKNQDGTSKWKIDGTTLEFITDVLNDKTATVGMSYLGGVKFTDLPTGATGTKLGNAECLVEIISSTLGSDVKVIHLDLYSATTKPYHWSTIYYNSLPDPIWSPDVMESEITTIDTKVDKNTNNISDLEIDVSNINTKLNTVQEGAEVNTINSISLNGTTLTPDSDKNVDILESIPKLIGTEEKPVNFYTDTEVGKYYIFNGYYLERLNSTISTKKSNLDNLLVFRQDSNHICIYNIRGSSLSNITYDISNMNRYNLPADGLDYISPVTYYNTLPGLYSGGNPRATAVCVDGATWEELVLVKGGIIYTTSDNVVLDKILNITADDFMLKGRDNINNAVNTIFYANIATTDTNELYSAQFKINSYTSVGKIYGIKITELHKIANLSDSSIITLIGTQESPITPDMLTEETKLYMLKGYINVEGVGNILSAQASSFILVRIQKIINSLYYFFYNASYNTNTGFWDQIGPIALTRYNKVTYNDLVGFGDADKEWSLHTINGRTPTGQINIYAPTSSGVKGQLLQSSGNTGLPPTWIDNPAPRTISNTIVSNWETDTTYTDFGYKADISITNLTENDTCEVIFNQTDASSGNYAQVNSSSAGVLTIYSKVNTEITIPTIIIIKGGY